MFQEKMSQCHGWFLEKLRERKNSSCACHTVVLMGISLIKQQLKELCIFSLIRQGRNNRNIVM